MRSTFKRAIFFWFFLSPALAEKITSILNEINCQGLYITYHVPWFMENNTIIRSKHRPSVELKWNFCGGKVIGSYMSE